MKTYEIPYLNYEGETRSLEIEVEDEQGLEDAKLKAIDENQGWGDGIKEIIQVQQL